MKKIHLLSLFLLFTICVGGQTLNVDSLENVLQTQNLPNKEQISIYKKMCSTYLRSDMDKLISYAEKGLQVSLKEKDKVEISEFYRVLGTGYYVKGNYEIALDYFDKGLEIVAETKDKELEAILYGSIANVYMLQNKELEALENALKGLSIFETLGNKRSAAISMCNIGNLYHGLLNEQQAMHYFEQAKDIAEEINDDYVKSLVYYQFAEIYSKNEEHDKAIEYNKKTYEISKSTNDKAAEILSLQALAYNYCKGKKEYNKAETYALECLQLAEEFGDPRLAITAQGILSTVYLYQKRYEECKDISLKVWESDSIMVKDYKPEVKNILANLTKSYIFLNNKEKAAYFFYRYQEIMQQHTDKGFQESISNMQTKYETEKKEMQIASLEKEKQLYTWLSIVGVLLTITLIIVLWQNIRNTRREKQLIATRSVLDGEMGERARMARDLHDRLSGNLSAIKIGLNDNDESLQNINDKLDNCIEEIRRVAHNLMPTSLQYGLKTALEDFASQFSNIKFHFFGEENRIEERKAFVVYCCANELVNNSLKHADAKNINIQLVQSEEHVSLTVQDDGKGFDEKSVTQGIGLKNIRDRVISCNGKIDITSTPDKGTETTIELKIKND